MTGYEQADITEEVLRIGFHFDRTQADQVLNAVTLQGETMNLDFKAYEFQYDDAGWLDLTAQWNGLVAFTGFNAD